MERMLTPEQAAEVLQTHPVTVRLWLRTGKLRGRKIGRIWRVPESECTRTNNHDRGDTATTTRGDSEGDA
jgi:excisionase family DNA binding protein